MEYFSVQRKWERNNFKRNKIRKTFMWWNIINESDEMKKFSPGTTNHE
jgi:hypothetical protein